MKEEEIYEFKILYQAFKNQRQSCLRRPIHRIQNLKRKNLLNYHSRPDFFGTGIFINSPISPRGIL